jgi:hypothetical protein
MMVKRGHPTSPRDTADVSQGHDTQALLAQHPAKGPTNPPWKSET